MHRLTFYKKKIYYYIILHVDCDGIERAKFGNIIQLHFCSGNTNHNTEFKIH